MAAAEPRSLKNKAIRHADGSTRHAVSYVRQLIDLGDLRPGDRLPAERDLAAQVGVSRPTVRAGLRVLSAKGIIQSRHGSGTFIPDGPPALGNETLSFLAALRGISRDEMYEARRILEVDAAGLAAERATADQMATLADEIAGMFAARNEPAVFLVHDINFHRTIAAASRNPILALLVEMVSALYYENRRETAERASDRDLRDAAEMHRQLYQAIRASEAGSARQLMHEHLHLASAHQAEESSAAALAAPRQAVSRGRARRGA